MSTLHILENDVLASGLPTRHRHVDRVRPHSPRGPLPRLHATDARGLLRQVLFVRQLSSRPLVQPNRPGTSSLRRAVVQLRITSPDAPPCHGVVRNYPWQVANVDRAHLVATFASDQHENVNFPFRFSARVESLLDGPRWVQTLSLRNESNEAMPAGLGHHPYFQRALLSAEDEVATRDSLLAVLSRATGHPHRAPIPVTRASTFSAREAIGSVFNRRLSSPVDLDNAPLPFRIRNRAWTSRSRPTPF